MRTTMATENNNKTLNVPNLRFSEFSGEWTKTLLNNYLEENKERNKRGIFTKNHVLSVSGDFGIVNQIELLGRSFAGKSVLDYHVVRTGNIVYTKSPLKEYPYGIVKVNGGVDGIVSTLYAVYKVKETANGKFVEYYFGLPNRTNRYFKPIVRIGAKHDMKIGNDEVLANYVVFPCVDEQKRISDFICLLDERIATQIKIIEKLESLIRGIVTKVCSGTFVKGEYVFLRDILTERHIKNTENYEVCSVSVSQGIVNQIDYLGRSFAAKETLHYNVVNYGDVVYTKSPTGDFPYGIVKRSNIHRPVAVSPLYGVYQPKNDYIGRFLHLYFKSPINAKNYLHRLIQKGAKNTINITNSHFLDNKVFITDDAELKNIVNLTSAIEDKLILANQMLDSLKNQKSYLLSKMFI